MFEGRDLECFQSMFQKLGPLRLPGETLNFSSLLKCMGDKIQEEKIVEGAFERMNMPLNGLESNVATGRESEVSKCMCVSVCRCMFKIA